MKKYIFLVISLLYFNATLSCPCEFSPEDQRPFFEQYEHISHPHSFIPISSLRSVTGARLKCNGDWAIEDPKQDKFHKKIDSLSPIKEEK
jgi:hypothetical protein